MAGNWPMLTGAPGGTPNGAARPRLTGAPSSTAEIALFGLPLCVATWFSGAAVLPPTVNCRVLSTGANGRLAGVTFSTTRSTRRPGVNSLPSPPVKPAAVAASRSSLFRASITRSSSVAALRASGGASRSGLS